jgi:hypothetical protein
MNEENAGTLEKQIDKTGHGGQAVTFEHVNSLKEVTIHAQKNETLNELWNKAYSELDEPRRDGDRLQTDAGKDVMPYLALTLHQLREEAGINTHKFEIVGPTGGA